MFRTREPQESLWQSEFLITPRKARSLSEDSFLETKPATQ